MKKIPTSVYRLQLSAAFPLKKATALIPYLFELGIEGIYCSPFFDAFNDGYDVSNPLKLNPTLGTMQDFERFCKTLKKWKMAHLLDVPNHMGIQGKRNHWWLDVLKKGQSSRYASFFDIDWQEGKIVLPILDRPYEEALKKREIQQEGKWLRYENYWFPKEKQHYWLCFWGCPKANYRHFCNIYNLVAMHMESEKVFKAYHKWVFELMQRGKVQALRIDHVDGLYDPGQHLKWLRKGKPAFVWAEKVLCGDEALPEKWDVDGTVGYDFLNVLSGVFVQGKNEKKMTRIYEGFINEKIRFEEVLYERRKAYIAQFMPSDIRYLSGFINDPAVMDAAVETMASFPVYRTYVKPGAVVRAQDRHYIKQAIALAKKRAPQISAKAFQRLQQILLGSNKEFLARFQQLTAPVMAKGLEDSIFYIYNRLISLNEVGGNPPQFGTSKEEFHAFNLNKLKTWPLSALASSTHDSKFSEDARLRVHALSEMPEKWQKVVALLKKRNQKFKTKQFPDLNTEYYLYQLLIALWPADPKRLWTCLHKALREAGVHTSWRFVNEKYEKAVQNFFEKVLRNLPEEFIQFHSEVSQRAALKSLSALVLKIGSCGIVSHYQGSENFHYCGVDPDNRLPVDFSKEDLKKKITALALTFRRDHADLFLKGEYIPLESPASTVAFMRVWKKERVVVVAQRFFADGKVEGVLKLPKVNAVTDLFTGRTTAVHNHTLSLASIFEPYYFALLVC